jgi:hypothetical protein
MQLQHSKLIDGGRQQAVVIPPLGLVEDKAANVERAGADINEEMKTRVAECRVSVSDGLRDDLGNEPDIDSGGTSPLVFLADSLSDRSCGNRRVGFG